MEAGLSDCLEVFRGATRLALRDGHLSNGEKRLLVKLAHALRLSEDEPRMVYDSVVGDASLTTGRELGGQEKMIVYEQVLEAVLIHTDRSED